MASGYVVAAVLEAAGLIGLVLALIRIRAERRAKAAELRSFLRSGQSAPVAHDIGGSHRWTVTNADVVTIPFATGNGRPGPTRDSAALSALRRAIVRGGQRLHAGRTVPISAG